MTAPDPLTAHTAAAIDRLLDDARSRYAIPATIALPLIRDRIRRLRSERTGFRASYHERALMALVDDLADVVEQLAGQMGGASVRCAHERLIDQREDGGMLWCADCREEVTR